MKFFRFLFSAMMVLAFMTGASTALAAPSGFLTGHWTATDPIDGDSVHMTLSGGQDGIYQLQAFDIHAPLACPETGGLGLLKGTATLDESTATITKTVVASCPSEGNTYPENTLSMLYDPVSDTIYDPMFDLLYIR